MTKGAGVARITLTCSWCKTEFERVPSKVRGKEHHYCSMQCMMMGHSPAIRNNPALLTDESLLIKICEQCGAEYRVKRAGKAPTRKYCSEQCGSAAHKPKMRGTNNPNYRHGRNQASARSIAYRNYALQCILCGWDVILDVHHIDPKHEGGTNDPANLAILCPNHHRMADAGLIQPEVLIEAAKIAAESFSQQVSRSNWQIEHHAKQEITT